MAVDILDLAAFYSTPLGASVQAAMAARIKKIWPLDADGNELVLGYGYRAALGRAIMAEGRMAFFDAAATRGDGRRSGARPAILTHEVSWPVRDDSVNRLLFLHAGSGKLS